MAPVMRMVRASPGEEDSLRNIVGRDSFSRSPEAPVFRHLPGTLVQGPYFHMGRERFGPKLPCGPIIHTEGEVLAYFDKGAGLDVLLETAPSPAEMGRFLDRARAIQEEPWRWYW